MKKQKGFTLIELMVVMAIIAILATAGLSAYTGYIKKARDATRIADVRAINTAIQGYLTANGNPPADMDAAVKAANNDKLLTDPLTTKSVCLTGSDDALGKCDYSYITCDGGAGYLVTAYFESKSNQSSYTTQGGVIGYNMGSCVTGGVGGSGPATVTVAGKKWMDTDLGGPGTFYQWNKKTAGWTAGWTGAGDGSGDPCPTGFRTPSSGELSALTRPNINELGLSLEGYLDAGGLSTRRGGGGRLVLVELRHYF